MDIEYTPDDIDAFVKGTLSPEKHNIFLQKLKENEALANAVAEAQFHFDVATRLIERDLRKMLNDWEAEKKNTAAAPVGPTGTQPHAQPLHLVGGERRACRGGSFGA